MESQRKWSHTERYGAIDSIFHPTRDYVTPESAWIRTEGEEESQETWYPREGTWRTPAI